MTIKGVMDEIGGVAIVVVAVGIIILFITTNLGTYLAAAFLKLTGN